MQRISLPGFALLLALLLVLSGCSGRPQRVPVSGKVLLDGKPVTGGTIRVVPRDNRRAEGRIDAQGRFTLTTFDESDGCVKGTHAVEVLGAEKLPNGQVRWLVPLKYQQISTSGLTVDITGPTDRLLIELKSEGQPLPAAPEAEVTGDRDPSKIK